MRTFPLWLAASACLAGAALADDARRRMPAQVPAAYLKECAACHVAYAPGLLPAASWARVMNGLERHYGSDASLDAATVQQLSDWLQAHAATDRRVRAQAPPPEDRITRSRWFARQHADIAPAVYRRPRIQSAANCAACHPGAAKGDFDDDHVLVPR